MTKISLKASPWHILLLSSPVVIGAFINGFYNPRLLAADITTLWIADTLQHLVIPLSVLLLLYKFFGIKPRDYGQVKPDAAYPAWGMFGAGVFAAVVLLIVSIVFWFAGLLVFGNESFVFAFDLVVPDNGFKLPGVVYMACTTGVIEETFFRGLAWK